MININVFSENSIDIESKEYHIETQEDMINFIKGLLNTAFYTGEQLCLEKADIDVDGGTVNFTEIQRWR